MSASHSDSRIRRLAGAMSVVTLCLGALSAISSLYFWFDWSSLLPTTPEFERIAPSVQASLLALIGLPALGLMLWGLWNAFWLFRNLRKGALFVVDSGVRIGRVGIAILFLAPVGIVARAVGTVIVSWNNPPGQQEIAVSVGSADVIMLVAGATLLMLGWAMKEATRIADENRQFV